MKEGNPPPNETRVPGPDEASIHKAACTKTLLHEYWEQGKQLEAVLKVVTVASNMTHTSRT